MSKLITGLLLTLSIPFSIFSQCEYGSPCKEIDNTCLDISNYPVINNFTTAGVSGGIPNNLPIIITINNTDNIQSTINNVNASGGGVIVLSPGVYNISSTINLKSNVVLRGANVDTVILESTIRSTWSQGKKNTLTFDNVTNSGLENLTILYKVSNFEPIDRTNWLDGGWCGNCFQNDPHGLDNLYVRQIAINSTSSNCWIDGCKILKSGTDPILLAGDHNTLRNNFIDQSYNKGGSGNGYYDVRGDYNLIINETVKRIRHFAIQQGAAYNVIINCYIEGDINFHNGDGGNNLLEKNEIKLPTWHGWDIFATGASQYGHQPPGPNNILVNNISNYKNQGPRYTDTDVIYTFTGYGQPDITNWNMPACDTFYPLVNNSTLSIIENTPLNKTSIFPIPTKGILNINGQFDLSEKLINIYNTTGKEVYFSIKNANQNKIEVDISHLTKGVYFLKINNTIKKIYKK